MRDGVNCERDLADALTPERPYKGTTDKIALEMSKTNAKCIGRLAALLVERKLITLDEAKKVCGITNDIELTE